MAEIIWVSGANRAVSEVALVANAVADSLNEDRVFVEAIGIGIYRLTFEDNTSYFDIDKPTLHDLNYWDIAISLFVNGKRFWNYINKGTTLQSFGWLLVEKMHGGFEQECGGAPHIWGSTAKDVASSGKKSTQVVTNLELPKPLKRIILGIAEGLIEPRVTVVSGDHETFELRFSKGKPIINLVAVQKITKEACGFVIEIVDDGKRVWHKSCIDMTPTQFSGFFTACADEGFDIDGVRWKWDSPITRYERPEVPHGVPPEMAGVFQQANKGGVVPADIKSIRAVALKYDGKVIAFRFKTDKGAFDMSKEAATRFGLSDLKTEKFIKLESLNGVLMSASEKQKNVFIPDVSENDIDCQRLINALFTS